MPVDQPVEFLIDYWGGCPECGMEDGDCELGEEGGGYVWFFCDTHRTRWNADNNHTSRPMYGERRREILGYRFVPWEDRPLDPVWREGKVTESVVKAWTAIRTRFPEIVPCVIPHHLTMTRAKRIEALRDPDGARRAVEEWRRRHVAEMPRGALLKLNGNVAVQGQAIKAPAYPPYRSYRCPKCGHSGNSADPLIHHTRVGIVCLKCGKKICN